VLPYFKRSGEIGREERVSNRHLKKYVELGCDDDYPHRPDAMGIGLVSLPLDDLSDVRRIEPANLAEMEISQSVRAALEKEFSVPYFMRNMKKRIEEKA